HGSSTRCAHRRQSHQPLDTRGGRFLRWPRRIVSPHIASKQGATMGAEARVKALGIELPPAPRPLGSYVTAARSGNLLFTSGHGPLRDGRVAYQGKVGRELTVEQGQEAARLTGLNLLATVRDAVGSLDRVRRVVKVLGMVQCADD